MSDDELPPSRLGTKEHWDMVYERENRVFNDIGDEGEVWFGEDSVSKMRSWVYANVPRSSAPIRVLECGSGNGTLLLSLLTGPEPAQSFHLTGIDYSAGAVSLGASVEAARREAIEEGDEDVIDEDAGDVANDVTCEWRTGDLLRDDIGETWDVVMDKGTFDALALSDDPVEEAGGRLPSLVYPERVARLVRPGGFFLITSCNFTEEEVKRRYTRPGVPFTFHSSVPHKSFSFGGSTGQTVCTVAFTRNADANGEAATESNGAAAAQPATTTNGTMAAVPNGTAAHTNEELFACIDCGGTKTEVVIVSPAGERARTIGPTGNMAEIGLQRSFETIRETVRKAAEMMGYDTASAGDRCPVPLKDVWLGISGCDTPLDQSRMSALLSPFFNTHISVHNDALLLGGALLTHGNPWGIAVIAGTGSICVALDVDAEGEVVQVARRGGHGYLLGDDGSAYDVGRCALRAAVHDYDAGKEVAGGLADDIRRHFGVKETGELLFKVHELDPTLGPIEATNAQKLRISSTARLVLDAFSRSPPDPLAAQAVHDAAAPLAEAIAHLWNQLRDKPLPNGQTRTLAAASLVCGGGVVRQDAYRKVLLDMCGARGVEFGAVEVVDDVAGQAAWGLVERARMERA